MKVWKPVAPLGYAHRRILSGVGSVIARKLMIPLLAGLLAVAGACGGDDDDSGEDPTPTRPSEERTAEPKDLSPQEIVESLAPSVVNILTTFPSGAGGGSGIVWEDNRHILTNAHVVLGSGSIKVIDPEDGREIPARVVALSPCDDVALLEVDRGNFEPAPIGDSDKLEPGEEVVALGYPATYTDQGSTKLVVTRGIVSKVNDSLDGKNDLIQTDAAINPGNSGGPLFDMAGNVVGVNTAILSQSGTGSGVGFAIPSNTVRRIVPYLIEFGSYEHSWLGISGMTVQPAQREAMNLDSAFKGVMVTLVSPNSPAERGGLRGTDRAINTPLGQIPVNGDIITAIDGQPIEDMNDLIMYLEDGTLPGDTVSLSVWRDGQQREVQVQLGARPS